MQTRSVVCTATVREAAEAMRTHRVGALVVLDAAGKLVGIISERDLVSRVIGKGLSPGAVLVQDVMTPEPAFCKPNTPFNWMQEVMMSRNIRHLPVVDGAGGVVGMVSSRDIMAHQVKTDRAMRSAAERVAMLSTCLKNLDFGEVVEMVAREVPHIFGAGRGVLFFDSKLEGGKADLLSRNRCSCSDRCLAERADMRKVTRSGTVWHGPVCEECRRLDVEGSCIIVSLEMEGLRSEAEGGSKGALCMCGFEDPMVSMDDLVRYKGTLIREVLNSNLTNARMYQKARHDAMTDALTDVGSRRLLEEQLEAELCRAQRYGHSLCVMMADIDYFKTINDTAGHMEGDEILRTFAQLVARQKRDSDVLARFGGDEFVLLMPETDLDGAHALAERIRRLTNNISRTDGKPMSVSAGVAEYTPDSEWSANMLIRHADLALYEAKRAGRNRVERWNGVGEGLQSADQVETGRIESLESKIEEVSHRSKEVFIQSIGGLVHALEAKDRYTRSHSENVMRYAVAVARQMDLPPESVDVIRRAATVHDIGKIGVPDHILRKPGELTAEEREIMARHPLIAVRILSGMQFVERELPLVRHHHERWDGGGYPDGLSGTRIPMGARILAVADAFDAITSDRVYRRSRTVAQALEILVENSGRQFDPDVANALIRWVDEAGRARANSSAVTAKELLAFCDTHTAAA